MIVSKSVSLEIEDLLKIEKKVREGKTASISAYVQQSIKKNLSEEGVWVDNTKRVDKWIKTFKELVDWAKTDKIKDSD